MSIYLIQSSKALFNAKEIAVSGAFLNTGSDDTKK